MEKTIRIYRDYFLDIPFQVWRPIWLSTLRFNNGCPLTGTPVMRSTGKPTVRVKYEINGVLFEKDLTVLFEENNPSLTSESSEAYSACVVIRGTGDLRILEIG